MRPCTARTPPAVRLLLVGDDPAAKSSSVPAASERSLAALSMPIFFPRNAEEIIAFGLYGIALSRASGCWPAMKIVADVADGIWTLERDFADFDITVPAIEWEGRPWTYRQRIAAAPPDSLLAEADLYGPRWSMVQAFNAANEIDAIEVNPAQAWLGIVAVGTAYDSVREALVDLGLSEAELLRAGIRILRVGMPYPLGADKVRRLAAGVDQVLVVEDKTAFVETQVKDILYGQSAAPQVLGKRAANGQKLIPPDGELTAARLSRASALGLEGAGRAHRTSPAGARADGSPHPAHRILLLGLPAQPVHRSARRLVGRRRHRMPHPGHDVLAHRFAGHRDNPDGRGGCAVDRPVSVHRRRAHLPKRR